MPLEDLHSEWTDVRVITGGSASFDAWVSKIINKLSLSANKPLIVALLTELWDMLMNDPLQYACGAQAAERGSEPGAWTGKLDARVLPNRADLLTATVAVLLMPGAPGVGKTTSLWCVLCASQPASAI